MKETESLLIFKTLIKGLFYCKLLEFVIKLLYVSLTSFCNVFTGSTFNVILILFQLSKAPFDNIFTCS